jgi:hypothetical protein
MVGQDTPECVPAPTCQTGQVPYLLGDQQGRASCVCPGHTVPFTGKDEFGVCDGRSGL